MIKIGVLGAGHLGRIHLRLLKEIPHYQVAGFYDPDAEASARAAAETGLTAFSSMEALLQACDAVDIVTPTLSHYDCAVRALELGRHVFIEKPVTNTVDEARRLVDLVARTGLKAQVGHVERFNPAFLASREYFDRPMFIETHRLAEFNPRGTDVSVVLDLMIHDLDIVLSVVKSAVRQVSASGVAVVSDSPDIANARIEFENGCVANLTSSRISMKNMRKSRFFQRDAYIAVDFLKKKSEIIRLKNLTGEPGPLDVTIDLGKGKGSKVIYFDTPKVEETNAIKMELEFFAASILHDTPVAVPIDDGYRALHLAHQVVEKMEASLNVLH